MRDYYYHKKKNYVCILNKTLYGLKKTPRSWYSRLEKYLQWKGFKRGETYNNIYIKVENKNMIIIVVYVDDIIFGSNTNNLSQRFVEEMQKEFDMSMLGELSFFLGLQIS